ncbi:MAG: Pyridoxal phosphate-dependent acyltransferase [Actinomycetota bacterium]|nr:Pyridoxal phosphate-dependent acyltransferase [Actinomycetota bacterium]
MVMDVTDRGPTVDLMDSWGVDSLLTKAVDLGMDLSVPVLPDATRGVMHHGDQVFVNFACISFLGRHVAEDALNTASEALYRYGLATGGSRLVQGISEPIHDLETSLAKICNKPAATSFASGLLANIGFIHAMSTRLTVSDSLVWDMTDTVFLLDKGCHWSILKGVESLRGTDRLFTFKHNDLDSLESLLRLNKNRRTIVVFETVYSVDGSMGPVEGIVSLCRRYGALSYADDANGFLVYGGKGRPFAREYEALDGVDVRMVSFSKAAGIEGGGIAGPESLVRAIEYFSGTSAFTATLVPAAAAAAVSTMELLMDQPEIVDGYLEKAALMRSKLDAAGFEINEGESYITTVHVGDERVVEYVRSTALSRGYVAPSFRFPAVPRGHSGLRIMPNIDHTADHFDGFIDVLSECRKVYPF